MKPPASLRHIAQGLEMLHFLGYPRVGGDVIQIGRQPGSPDDTEPGASTRRWRSKERRYMKRLKQIAEEIDADLRGDPIERPRSWRCPACGRWQRGEAVACDRCVPQVLREDAERSR